MRVSKSIFGKTEQGQEVIKYTIVNHYGISVSLLNYGATILSILAPNKYNKYEEITINYYDNFQDLATKSPYYGATIGRVANRIANGQFSIGVVNYKTPINSPPNTLHGGIKAFDKEIWDTHIMEAEDQCTIEFRYYSPDGEEGFPGNLDTKLTYVLNNQNQLIIHFEAVTDQLTPVNLTNHAYWNLSGNAKEDVLGHRLQLHDCNYYLLNNSNHIPGGIVETKNTPFDFSEAHTVGERIDQTDGGYDHCYVFANGNLKKELKKCATIFEPKSGRKLEIASTYGGVVLYSSNGMSGSPPHAQHYGLCAEPQYWPDAVNQPKFPPIILEPGETYHHTTVHTFSVEKFISV